MKGGVEGASARPVLGRLDPVMEKRADGSLIVSARQPLPPYGRHLGERLAHWASVAPDRPMLAERDASGGWRRVTYRQAAETVDRIAAGLLSHDLSAERPIAILSGNDIEHALLALAAMSIGVPYCPVSPPYSLVSRDFGKLRYVLGLLTPGLVYVSDGEAFAPALKAALAPGTPVVAGRNETAAGAGPWRRLAEAPPHPRLAATRAAVGPDTIAKFLLTSGSTGEPKAVINTQRMLMANQAMLAQCFPFLEEEPPIFLDWLPWNHTFGSNHNFGMTIVHGGTLYIDAGKPMPGAVAATVANLREISPTAYFNVPKGFEALLPHLRDDGALARSLFRRCRMLFYAGAGLSQSIWDAYQELALRITGRRIPFVTGLGATETAPSSLMNLMEVDGPGNMGHPMVGARLKIVPTAGKLEVRIAGPNVTPGYWRSPTLTAAAFDEEGYYRMGDAVRFVTPGDPAGGFLFDGRISEDFKLATGTWVSVGPLRSTVLAGLDPLAKDLAIAGHDRDDIAVLVFPDIAACRALAGAPADAADAAIIAHPAVRAAFREKLAALAARSTGSSTRVARLKLLAEPPSIDKGEITDKGSLNQRAVLTHRAADVASLYAEPPGADIISA